MLFNIHTNVACVSSLYRRYHLPAEHFALLLAGVGDFARVTSALHLSFYLRNQVPDTTPQVLFIHCWLSLNKPEAKHKIASHL